MIGRLDRSKRRRRSLKAKLNSAQLSSLLGRRLRWITGGVLYNESLFPHSLRSRSLEQGVTRGRIPPPCPAVACMPCAAPDVFLWQEQHSVRTDPGESPSHALMSGYRSIRWVGVLQVAYGLRKHESVPLQPVKVSGPGLSN